MNGCSILLVLSLLLLTYTNCFVTPGFLNSTSLQLTHISLSTHIYIIWYPSASLLCYNHIFIFHIHNINLISISSFLYNPLLGWFKRQWWFEWYWWYSGWLGGYSGRKRWIVCGWRRWHIGRHIGWWIGCLGALTLGSFATLSFFASLFFDNKTRCCKCTLTYQYFTLEKLTNHEVFI